MKIYYSKAVTLGADESLEISICNGETGDVVCSELHIDSEAGDYTISCNSGEKSWDVEKGINKADLSLADVGTAGSVIYVISGADSVVITASADDTDLVVKVVY